MNDPAIVWNTTQTEEWQGRLPVDCISVNPDINPRKERNATSFSQLKDSISKSGVGQPIQVRPINGEPGRFEVVAGNGRYEASVEVKNPDIPVIAKAMTDEEAREAARRENMEREDMSVIEEAEEAKRLMGLNDNDKDAVASILGWSRKKLDGRILLTHCGDAVRSALVQKQISVGHAEVLATMEENAQPASLTKIVENGWTVADTVARVSKLERVLADAIFDQAGCSGCKHNTDSVQDFFDTVSAGAKCRNPICYNEKEKEALEAKKSELNEEHGRVAFDNELPANSTTLVRTAGEKGVGQEQARACVQCSSFGCIISTKPSTIGHVTRDICFDLACNAEKVKAYQHVIASDQQSANSTASNTPDKKAPAKGGASKTTTKGKGKAKAGGSAAPKATPKGVKRLAFKAYDAAVMEQVTADEKYQLALAVSATLQACKSSTAANEILTKHGLGNDSWSDKWPLVVSQLYALEDATLNTVLAEATSAFIGNRQSAEMFEGDEIAKYGLQAMVDLPVDLKAHFTVDGDYLKALTKGAILQLLEDSGFKEAYIKAHPDDDKAFKSLTTEKVADMNTKIMAFKGFDWAGYIPSVVQHEQYTGKLKSAASATKAAA